MKILQFHGRGHISRLIRWQTRGHYSHTAILLEDPDLAPNTIIESWQGQGVRIKAISDWSYVDVYSINGLDRDQEKRATRFLESQVGKGYDYRSVFRFLSRKPAVLNDRFFCSELAVAAMVHAEVRLLKRIDAHNVSPSHLATSPLLTYVPICEHCGINLEETRRAYCFAGSKRQVDDMIDGRPLCIQCRPRTAVDPEPVDLVAYQKHMRKAISKAITVQDIQDIDRAMIHDYEAGIPGHVMEALENLRLSRLSELERKAIR